MYCEGRVRERRGENECQKLKLFQFHPSSPFFLSFSLSPFRFYSGFAEVLSSLSRCIYSLKKIMCGRLQSLESQKTELSD